MLAGPGRALAVAMVVGLAPQWSLAAAYHLEARTEAQAYQFRGYSASDPFNPTLLPRRRLVQYLGLNVYELVSGQPLGFESSLRVFADLGLPRGEAARVDGLQAEDADLLYANVHYTGKNTALRIGRQTYIDLMDYMAFDGVRFRYMHALGIGAEAYAGLWVKGASLMGSSVYQPDGTRESDMRRVSLQETTAAAELDDVEPLLGVKLLAENILGVSGSVAYRRAWVTGKTDVERISVESRYGKGRGLNALAGLEYDLFMGRVSQARALLRWDAEEYAVSGELLRVNPVLSSDSIFLYFASSPRDELRVRGDYTPVGPYRYYLQLQTDVRHDNLNSDLGVTSALSDPDTPASGTFGTSVGAAARWGLFRAAADLTYKTGFGGSQLWIDVTGGYNPLDSLWSVDGRLSFADVQDQLNPLLRGSFIGGQVWGSYLLTPSSRVSIVVEQNFNKFTRSDTKLFFLFDLKAAI